jgi:hypothetical protein
MHRYADQTMTPTNLCILCKKQSLPPHSEEHVFPYALTGDWMVLRDGEVCASCNNIVSRLDACIVRQLGMIRMLSGHRENRKGKVARVEAPGFLAVLDPIDPWVFLNASNRSLPARDGTIVPSGSGREDGVTSKSHVFADGTTSTQVTWPFRVGKMFSRALIKIAFEALCIDHGRELCLRGEFDSIREYILTGRGKRYFLIPKSLKLEAAEGQQVQPQIGIRTEPYGTAGFIAFVGIGAPFVVDLTPDAWGLRHYYRWMPEDLKSRVNYFPDDLLKKAQQVGKKRSRQSGA